jgi:hypothetical protein
MNSVQHLILKDAGNVSSFTGTRCVTSASQNSEREDSPSKREYTAHM